MRTWWGMICLAVLAVGCKGSLCPMETRKGGHDNAYVSPFELETVYEFTGELMPPAMRRAEEVVILADAEPDCTVRFKNIRVVRGHPPVAPDGTLKYGINGGYRDYVKIAGPKPWGQRFLLGYGGHGILMVAPVLDQSR